MGRKRKADKETWTDEERIALFMEKGRELIQHPFVRAYLDHGGGFSSNIERLDSGGRCQLTTSIRGANPTEVQAVEAMVRLFYLKTEAIALDQMGGVIGRVAPGKVADAKRLLKAYRQNLGCRPDLGVVELKTTGYTEDFTFGKLLDLHLYGNATHVSKGPRKALTRLMGNQMSELLFGQSFYQQALFMVVDAVKHMLEILNDATTETS